MSSRGHVGPMIADSLCLTYVGPCWGIWAENGALLFGPMLGQKGVFFLGVISCVLGSLSGNFWAQERPVHLSLFWAQEHAVFGPCQGHVGPMFALCWAYVGPCWGLRGHVGVGAILSLR